MVDYNYTIIRIRVILKQILTLASSAYVARQKCQNPFLSHKLIRHTRTKRTMLGDCAPLSVKPTYDIFIMAKIALVSVYSLIKSLSQSCSGGKQVLSLFKNSGCFFFM